MNCPNCGAELPEGSTWCAACGTALGDAQPQASVNDQLFSQTPVTPVEAAVPAKKSSTGIIAAIVAVLVIVAAAAVVFLTVGKYNGTYKLSEVSAMGMTLSAEDFEEFSGQKLDMSLKVSFGKCKLSADMAELGVEGSGSCKIKIKGDKVTLTADGEDLEGTYDSKKKSITIIEPESGVSMTFTK